MYSSYEGFAIKIVKEIFTVKIAFQEAEYHGVTAPEEMVQLQWQNGGSGVCGHCWMTSILLPSTRWPHILKPPSKALISQWQCWLQMLSSWESPGGCVTCFHQCSAVSSPTIAPQLQREFTAEIDHNTSIFRLLTLTLTNPLLKQLEIISLLDCLEYKPLMEKC